MRGDIPRAAEDAFNLYGLRGIIPHFRDCLDMVLDCGSDSDPEPAEWSGRLYKHARDLYGLIHARFILTGKGMAHMVCAQTVAVLERARFCCCY